MVRPERRTVGALWHAARPMRILLLVGVAVAGCDADSQRVSVEGTVTVDGQPLAQGTILFVPTGDTHGPKAAAIVHAGRYRIDQEQGPYAGRFRVEIRGDRHLPADILTENGEAKYRNYRPPPDPIGARFNDRSRLTADVSASGPNVFDFDLTKDE